MLARANRIVSGADFRRVIRQGRKLSSREAVISVIQTAQDSPVRFGVVTGKSVGNAVVRNRIRRRVRAAARAIIDQRSCAGVEVVVRALPGSDVTSVESWRSALERACGQ
ncbi:MAG TPA: ribonuclease P protein component [Microbacteriaceae bacterium]|nr:ribonuclease P protein component [Microbacteriaceae bacterium]